jgi:hypothetical protein
VLAVRPEPSRGRDERRVARLGQIGWRNWGQVWFSLLYALTPEGSGLIPQRRSR